MVDYCHGRLPPADPLTPEPALTQAQPAASPPKAVLFDLYGTLADVRVDEESPSFGQALAADARDPALAIEVYLASRLVIDGSCPAGQQHLQELRQALRLPPALAESLEQQARQVLEQGPQAAA